MRSYLLCALTLIALSSALRAEESVTNQSDDHFSVEFAYDGEFPTTLSLGWQRSVSQNDAIETSFYLDAFDQTLIWIEDWQHTFGDLMVAPGILTTFGTASWNGTPNTDTKTYVFRDIGPFFTAIYSNKYFYGETFNAFFFPIQQDQAAALTLGISRFFVAGKWNEFGVGPRLELYVSKEGHGPLTLPECRVGGSIFKHFERNSIDLFVGYNFMSSPSFLGKPLNAGPVFRVSFAQLF